MTVTARRGTELRCRNWRAEALLRLLENVLEVGERPEELVVYASIGKAVKDWDAYQRIVDSLQHLEEDQTLVLQTGRPVAVLNTHAAAPMVVSAVNNTVGNWATEERFYSRLAEHKTIWGGLTAAAWQYIGRQGVLGGTYELLRAALEKHFRESSAPHRWVLTAGLGGMGSSQPISARMLELSPWWWRPILRNSRNLRPPAASTWCSTTSTMPSRRFPRRLPNGVPSPSGCWVTPPTCSPPWQPVVHVPTS